AGFPVPDPSIPGPLCGGSAGVGLAGGGAVRLDPVGPAQAANRPHAAPGPGRGSPPLAGRPGHRRQAAAYSLSPAGAPRESCKTGASAGTKAVSRMGGFWQRLRAALGRDKDAPQQAGSRNRPAGEPALPGGGRGRSGAAADREVQKLVQGLRHADPNVRAAAARKLGELGARAGPSAVPALVEALADEDDGVRSSAALSLGVFGVQAAAAVPALVKALGDPDDDVRSSAG